MVTSWLGVDQEQDGGRGGGVLAGGEAGHGQDEEGEEHPESVVTPHHSTVIDHDKPGRVWANS